MTTPQQYRNIRQQFERAIKVYNDAIDAAEAMAKQVKIPADENLVAAEAIHIVPGQIFWYKDDGPHWHMVERVAAAELRTANAVLYTAEDGCDYGINNAFVDVRDIIQ